MVTQRNTYVEESVDDSTPKRDVPALPRSSVYRDRLRVPEPTDLATELGKGSIVVVTGPGGAGKSTLMAAWASELLSRGAGIGWASLGPDDNDPGTLWTTVLGALRDAVARGADAAEVRGDSDAQRGSTSTPRPTALASMQAPGPPAASGVRRSARPGPAISPVPALADARRRPPRAGPRGPGLPGTCCCAGCPVASISCSVPGADPAIHLPRLRLEGRVHDIRDGDLRFRPEEAEAMLAAHGVRLTHTQLNRLHSLTEGWAAGLGLAAASLRTGRDVDDFLTSFAGDTGAMAGYLIEEVLAGLDAETLDFMLLTCVAERLTPELASRLSGRDDAGGSPREAGRGQHAGQCHHRLRHHLPLPLPAARLPQRSAEASGSHPFGQLHAQTAAWFSEHGLDAEALEHAVVSQDEQITHAMLHRYGVRLVLSGRPARADPALIEGAPPSVRVERPMEVAAPSSRWTSATSSGGEVHVAAADAAPPSSRCRPASAASSDGVGYALPADRLVASARLSAQRIRGDVDADALAEVTGDSHPGRGAARNLRDLSCWSA